MNMQTRHPFPVTATQAAAGARRLTLDTAAVMLAGGKGTRLGALTRQECKPALPFGAYYRNIDFSLSNCVNSGIYRIGVATQYQDGSLIRHLARTWSTPAVNGVGFVEAWRAELHGAAGSYRGTADAVFQNWHRIEALDAKRVLILAGDHVYKMDYRPMLLAHVESGADITVGCVEIPIESARDFGVMSVTGGDRVCRFAEKPSRPEGLPGRPDRALGSMGIYVFNRKLLGGLLREDALETSSGHDFGHDLLPRLIDRTKVMAHRFTRNAPVGAGYWRDVGTVTAYWRAHMELLDGIPGFSLEDEEWPLRTENQGPEQRQASRSHGDRQRSGDVVNSLLASGCEVDRASIHHSVLFRGVSVAAGTRLSNAVVLPDTRIGRNCRLADIVIGSGTRVPDGTVFEPLHGQGGAMQATPALLVAEPTAAGHGCGAGTDTYH
jgi:glucose-1-phosphate adenylyltransferase